MSGLSVRERRMIAVAILVFLAAVGWLGLVSPIVEGFSARAAERERLLDELGRGRRLIGSLGAWRAAAARQHATSQSFEMRASSAEMASDMARQRLVSAVLAHGGVVRVVRQQSAGDGEVRLHADLELSLPQLASSISAIENQKPYAIVEKISVSESQSTGVGRLSPLDVSVDIGYYFVLAPN